MELERAKAVSANARPHSKVFAIMRPNPIVLLRTFTALGLKNLAPGLWAKLAPRHPPVQLIRVGEPQLQH